ncbi:glycoside hydrolase family 65 protein [Cellulomonas sp. SLBN-39]|uniref:glycoside hydrolase family 65 protein n=1 Tax=Cellulomonas sp. SLBN-39 TaxID=2768446 RepID=UPI00115182D0|nr:glycosyl hydrolase family 65 protein [Cellulomonas sp. SLBN-39]TQL02633.1 alpha,alpha-trehalose phosphorylase [Cellulomonas sp. SLBN-39]
MSKVARHRRYVGGPDPLDRSRFALDPWRLVERRVEPADRGTTETLFAVGNGYVGVRGTPEEGRPAHEHGTFVNGFHETWPIQHAEAAYGLAEVGQTIVNVPDATVLQVYVDDEPLVLGEAELLAYERTLDMADGVLRRDLVWRTPTGNRVRVRSTRMVSFTQRHLVLASVSVTLEDASASVVVSSQVVNRYATATPEDAPAGAVPGAMADPRRGETLGHRVLQPVLHRQEGDRAVLAFRCATSGMTLAVAADHLVEGDAETTTSTVVTEDVATTDVRVQALPGQTLTVTKLVSYHTSDADPAAELAARCGRTLDRVRAQGVAQQLADQRAWLDAYWTRSDVEVPGQPSVQQAVRWNLFQLAQASARAEGHGVPAKGLTGSGYGGHYFWDTEIYVVPFLTYTSPTAARNALRFRSAMLPAAESRARDLNEGGALFPWRTINGAEASAYYAAGTAQYHINADIAYAIAGYVDVTGDEEFLAREGIDVLVQTARLWVGLGFWRGEGPGSFHIHGVTGPDEYTTVVNDNLYTNVMARMNLRAAAAAMAHLAAEWPAEHARVVAHLGVDPGEVAEWVRVADAIAIPYDDVLGIHPQDAQFHEREVWDLKSTPSDRRPLLLHYHPLVIYRFQVLKQADVVLATFLRGEDFTPELKRADFEYYEPITTGDSSLSAVVQSIMAAEVGYHELALDYFHDALFVDLADRHGNAVDGVHVASAGGVWSALVHGFAGMRRRPGGRTSFDPRLPATWQAVTFRVALDGTRLAVTVRQDAVELVAQTGPGVVVDVRGRTYEVAPGAPVVVPLDGQGPRIDGKPEPRALRDTVRPDGSVVTASVPPLAGTTD